MLNRRRKVEVFVDNKLDKSYYQYEQLMHCNWGWDNRANGYYNNGAFNASEGAVVKTSNNSISDQDSYYQFKLECIYDVKP